MYSLSLLNKRGRFVLFAMLSMSIAGSQGLIAIAQSMPSSSSSIDGFRSGRGVSFVAADPDPAAGGSSVRGGVVPTAVSGVRPFSRIAFGVDVSPLGIGGSVTTNIDRYVNLRFNGSAFSYTEDNISTQGFNVTAKLNLASARVSADVYPLHNGLRFSTGLLFYNQDKADVTFVPIPGTSFSLGDHNYYSAAGAQAVHGTGAFGLGNGTKAFTMTTGWGNVIPASHRHFTFPFEVGVAFMKSPTVALALTGYVCDSHGANCVNVATDPTAQADLKTQIHDYQGDYDQLKTYPIVSFGVAYNFSIRRGSLYR